MADHVALARHLLPLWTWQPSARCAVAVVALGAPPAGSQRRPVQVALRVYDRGAEGCEVHAELWAAGVSWEAVWHGPEGAVLDGTPLDPAASTVVVGEALLGLAGQAWRAGADLAGRLAMRPTVPAAQAAMPWALEVRHG